MLKHITAAAVMGLMLAVPAAAQTKPTPSGRPVRQMKLMSARIRQGVRSGQLTQQDVAQLRQLLQHFRAEARQLRADGSLSPADRQTLRQQWKQISRLVYAKKHKKQ